MASEAELGGENDPDWIGFVWLEAEHIRLERSPGKKGDAESVHGISSENFRLFGKRDSKAGGATIFWKDEKQREKLGKPLSRANPQKRGNAGRWAESVCFFNSFRNRLADGAAPMDPLS